MIFDNWFLKSTRIFEYSTAAIALIPSSSKREIYCQLVPLALQMESKF